MSASEQPDERAPSRVASTAAVEERSQPVVHSDREIMSGTPVFFGTRVPVDAMFDYLEGNYRLDEFLDDFPSVNRAQVLDALDMAREAVLRASARPDR
jgi:uncharacterized protein (DUF433 family)